LADLEDLKGLHQRDPFKSKREYVSKVEQFLTDWTAEHPDDPFAEKERSWYERKYGLEIPK
jgi:hypothetical protein